jgi:hypothetical protein
MFLNIEERTPSRHSLVLRFSQPHNSSELTALGSTYCQIVVVSIAGVDKASAKFFQTADLPRPEAPIRKTECLTSRISKSYWHLSM